MTDLSAMGERLYHRGSIGHEWSISGTVHFGQRVKAGQMESCQPVAFDGFLDNANQLLNMLEMRDNIGKIPDKDIVLALHRRHGLRGFQHLSGQFAIAIWDDKEGCLVLVRDRWGARLSLFYAREGASLFASEYKALLAIPEIPAVGNRDAILYSVRTRQGHPNACFLAGVEVVPKGAYLVLNGSRTESKRFWDIGIDVLDLPQSRSMRVLSEKHYSGL